MKLDMSGLVMIFHLNICNLNATSSSSIFCDFMAGKIHARLVHYSPLMAVAMILRNDF